VKSIAISRDPKQMNLATLRSPTPARYNKMFNSLRKNFHVNLITGTVVPTIHLRMNVGTALSYPSLLSKVTLTGKPTIIDINALVCARLNFRKDLVVDFRTPFSYELNWLGHNFLSLVARLMENSLHKFGLITAANELMAKYCAKLGARNVEIIPNYPTRDFKPNVEANEWRALHNLTLKDRVVLFSGGVRLREIYGLDLLLESWKLVEDSADSAALIVLGDECADYMKNKAQSMMIKRLILPGRVGMKDVANWINCADVCVAPRTPGFSDAFYNDKDSTKISEYATLFKPIVATCYAPSNQYFLVKPNPEDFAEAILKGLEGKIAPSKAHFWEENEPKLLKTIDRFCFG
jgi:glycosyltransferase involved in cell wall biosynthesis